MVLRLPAPGNAWIRHPPGSAMTGPGYSSWPARHCEAARSPYVRQKADAARPAAQREHAPAGRRSRLDDLEPLSIGRTATAARHPPSRPWVVGTHHPRPVPLRLMIGTGEPAIERAATRGGSQVETIQPTDVAGRRTSIDRAAARKRLLYARFRGWSQASDRYPRGQIGPAGEDATRAAILR